MARASASRRGTCQSLLHADSIRKTTRQTAHLDNYPRQETVVRERHAFEGMALEVFSPMPPAWGTAPDFGAARWNSVLGTGGLDRPSYQAEAGLVRGTTISEAITGPTSGATASPDGHQRFATAAGSCKYCAALGIAGVQPCSS
jgi:hypothetical protein